MVFYILLRFAIDWLQMTYGLILRHLQPIMLDPLCNVRRHHGVARWYFTFYFILLT